jgi:hypothetical protein
MAWGTMTIGSSANQQLFAQGTQPTLLIQNQNFTVNNGNPGLGLMPKKSQTGNLLQTYVANSTTKAPFAVTVQGNPLIAPQGSGVTPATTQTGALALTSGFILCVYNGSGWVRTSDGSTACTF